MLNQALLPEFDREMATTRRVLERLPDDALAWKPHEKSFSMGDLATHITNIPSWVASTIDHDELDMGAGFEPPPTGKRDDLLRIFDENVKTARAKIEGADDAALMREWALKSGDTEFFRMPKVAVLRGFVMNHMIHHRGQLSVYLRLKDVPVPSIYGPSADEESF
jgi:uncharacterized damage-inducible protein DinB